MNKLFYTFITIVFAQTLFAQSQSLRMWYDEPADEWMKSLPIGNGRLSGMVFGEISKEKIALNEITLWAGQQDTNLEYQYGKTSLRDIQHQFLAGEFEKGHALARENWVRQPNSFGTHLPFGDIELVFQPTEGKAENYIRALDLAKGVATVSYEQEGTTFFREYFCSNPANIMVIRLSASKKEQLSFDIRLNPLQKSIIKTDKNSLCFTGQVSFPVSGVGGVCFYGEIRALLKGGDIKQNKESLSIEKADEVVLLADFRTNYLSDDMQDVVSSTLGKAENKGFEVIKQEHEVDFGRLFNRVSLFLGTEKDHLPTDTRWKLLKNGSDDAGLVALFFQYGRYLLISSSRENSPLPANLQGVWNDNLACNMPWTCDYHLDINTQQNYWAANVCNLVECNAPLVNYIESLVKVGKKTARTVYGCDGWVAHTVANAWGFTFPGWGVEWGLHVTAGAWLASHLWETYLFTKDREYLSKVYPVLKQAGCFFLDYMIEDPKSGYLLTGPSCSPENAFLHNGKQYWISMMPTCDRVIVYEILQACKYASEILQTDEEFRISVVDAIGKLPPLQIGKYGQVQEWLVDYEEAMPNHRHTSHLLALYPYSQISLNKTPELAKAAAVTIDRRLNASGWEDVEWSRANMINFFARLKESRKAYASVVELIGNLSRENLLTISPKGIASAPYDIFIFDGNESGTAGIAEMLLQSHEGYIELLPSLPDEWSTGSFRGLRARGGFEVDLSWENSNVKCMEVKALIGNVLKLKVPQNKKGKTFYLNNKIFNPKILENDFIQVDLKKDDTLKILYK